MMDPWRCKRDERLIMDKVSAPGEIPMIVLAAICSPYFNAAHFFKLIARLTERGKLRIEWCRNPNGWKTLLVAINNKATK